MRTQVFSLPLNAKQWVVGPLSVIRKNGKTIPTVGRDSASEEYKAAVREELVNQGLEMFEAPYSLSFYIARRVESYRSEKTDRLVVKKTVDATNMQKLIEDSFQDYVIDNDRNVIHVSTTQLEQSRDAVPAIVVVLRSGLESYKGGVGYGSHVFPADVVIECEKALHEAIVRSEESLNPTLDNSIAERNKW